MLQNAPEVACKLMYICAVYPWERKSYGSFRPTISTMGSLKIKDLKLVDKRGFNIKAHFENDSLQNVQEREFLLSSVPHPEIIRTIA